MATNIVRIGGGVDPFLRCIVKVQVRGADDGPTAGIQAVIDTGASQSCIRDDVAEQLRLRHADGRRRAATANGFGDFPVAPISVAVEIPGEDPLFLADVHAIVAPCDPPMLFGMDLLDGGVLVVDRVRQTWKWAIREASR